MVGYLGRDPELNYRPDGTPVCNFSIAATEKRKGRNGETEEITQWVKVSAWGRLAELANEYLTKGRQTYVEGRLRTSEYTDRDGVKRFSLEMTASEIHFLGRGGNGDNKTTEMSDESHLGDNHLEAEETAPAVASSASSKSGTKGGSKRGSKKGDDLVSVEDDEIPF